MQNLVLEVGQKAIYTGIEVLTADGTRRAKFDTSDREASVEVISGDPSASGTVLNMREVTDEKGTGDVFDVEILHGVSGSASVLRIGGDGDRDQGEIREVFEDVNLTTLAQEAGTLTFPAPTITQA